MRILHVGIALALTTSAFADTVKLKNGKTLEGTYLGGSARQVRLEVGDQIQTFDVSDIDRIEFGGLAAPAPPPAPAPAAAAAPPPRPATPAPLPPRPAQAENDRPVLMRPDSTPSPRASDVASQANMELPAGTNLVIRLIDGVDSETARAGQTFQASLDQPVVIGEKVAIPRGADVVVKLVDSKESGTFTGRAELALNLQSIRVDGRMVEVNTQTVSRESDSQGAQTAKRGAVGAVLGAGLGAVLGGGKGAATGAAVGGAAGAGTQVITKGRTVRIPSETRLTFVLDTPVRI
jgi:hypothetical protein